MRNVRQAKVSLQVADCFPAVGTLPCLGGISLRSQALLVVRPSNNPNDRVEWQQDTRRRAYIGRFSISASIVVKSTNVKCATVDSSSCAPRAST